MEAQFQAYNESGALQFDALSSAFGYVGKGSFTATDHWSGTPYGSGSTFLGTYGSVATDYDFDLVFFRCADAFVLPANRLYTADPARTVRAFTNYCWPTPPAGFITRWPAGDYTGLVSHTVEYWCFRSMRYLLATPHGVGQQLFGPDGGLRYDSNLDPVRVVQDNRIIAASYQERTQALPSASCALMKYGTTADAATTGSLTFWSNVAAKAVSGGYKFRSFSNPLRHSSAAGNLPGIYTGGIIAIDVSRY